MFKRGSDSLLEKKLKEQIAKPRSLTNRAQSLDLTFHLSRITEQSSRLPPPDSPTNSTYGTGGDNSPTSLHTPTFPSVYGPPSNTFGHRTPQSSRSGMPDSQLQDELPELVTHLRLQ